MPDRDAQIRLGIELDQGALNQIKQATDSILRDMQRLGGEATTTTESYRRLAAAGAEISKGQSVDNITRQFVALGKATKDEIGALIDLRRSLRDIGASESDIKRATAAFTELTAAQAGGGKFNVGLSSLRQTGSALNQLGLDEIGRPIQIAGDIGQVGKEISQVTEAITAMGISTSALLTVAVPVALAIGAVALAVQSFNVILDQSKAGLASAITSLDTYYATIQAGTTDLINKQIAEFKQKKDAADQERAQLQETLDSVSKVNQSIVEQLDFKGIPSIQQIGEKIGEAVASSQLQARIDVLKNTSGGLQAQIDGLTNSLDSSKVAANDAAEAERKASVARLSALDAELSRELKIETLKRGGASAKTVQELFDAAAQEVASINDRRDALEAEALISADGEKQLEAYQKRLKSLTLDYEAYGLLLDEIKGKNEIIAIGKSIADGIGKAVESTVKAVQAGIADIEARNVRVAAVQQKYNDATKAADERSLQERATIQKRLNDALVSAARTAAEAAANALQKLEQAGQDLATDLQRDFEKSDREAAAKVLDIQIQKQREEEKAYRDHYRQIRQIQEDAQANEIKFLLDRNFLGLYESRLSTTRSITRANDDFGGQQQDRRGSQQQEIDDLKRSVAQQRSERQIAYQQQLVDARLAYRRELDAAEQNRRTSIERARATYIQEQSDLTTKLASERTVRYNAYVEELKLASTYGTERIKVEQKVQQALLDQASATLRSVGVLAQQAQKVQQAALSSAAASAVSTIGSFIGNLLTRRAGGGSTTPGDAYLVNEPGSSGREGIGGMQFMGGMGVYVPFKPGYVNPGTKNQNTSNTFYITSHDPAGVRSEVLTILEKVIR